MKKQILEMVLTAVISFATVFGITHYVVQPVKVEGDSMYPTYENGQIGVSVIAGKDHIERFDVVILNTNDGKKIVKRVIGLPGETLEYKDDVLHINGVSTAETFLDKEYVVSGNMPFTSDIEAITLAEDEYYCLGDNRWVSKDSRYYGPFKAESIIAKGVYVLG